MPRRDSFNSSTLVGLSVVFLAAAATVSPIPVLAQDGVLVQGRVFEADGEARIWNARVELEGHGATLTSRAGTFSFEDVEPGEYTLQVDAFGYASESRELVVEGATTVLVPLEVAPLPIDSLLVEVRTIDIKGRVRDPEKDLLLVNAEILTNQVSGTLTDAHGRFTIDDVLEHVPVRVIVMPFGYLTVDTVLVPDKDDGRYLFEVKPDPWVEDMIADQIRLLDERSAGLRGRTMSRERLVWYAGTHTVDDVLHFEYREHVREGIRCMVLDEKRLSFGSFRLQHILPEELELIEFLFGGTMMRMYTREFMQDMFDGVVELRTPVRDVCR